MINTEKNIYINETEIKPNKYSLLVMAFCLGVILFTWGMNEVGFFRVQDIYMRIGSIIPLLTVGIPLVVLLKNKKLLAKPYVKYITLAFVTIFTYTTTILMTFHTTILLLFPMFMAMLYRSKLLGKLAFVSSISCTILSPIIAYLLGTWDVELFKELILIATGVSSNIDSSLHVISLVSVLKILLYIVLPRLLIVGAASLLMFYVIQLNSEHVKNQMLLNKLSHVDALTGFYNQNFYQEIIGSKVITGKIGVIFFDVNGLKRVNDTLGHEYGDLLLQRCAKSINDVIDQNKDYVFRAGGDEFVVISEDSNEDYIKHLISMWQRSIIAVNEENRHLKNQIYCSMAYGYTYGDASALGSLIKISDEKMYVNKTQSRPGTF